MSPSATVLRNARREALFVAAVWIACCVYTCGYAALFAYRKDPMLHLVLGMPAWVFYGIVTPWVVCTVVTCFYALWGIQDEDLGEEAPEAGGSHA